MNVGSKIGFNKSSLLSLKAELARKNEEASHAKANTRSKPIKPFVKIPKDTNINTNISNEEDPSTEKEKENEQHPDIESSRKALEAKARLYEKFSQNPDSLSEESPFLVDFSKKSDSKAGKYAEEEDEDSKRVETDSDEYDPPSDPEDDWVEYTDCLGRTRRCLRRDLADLKAQDAQLFESTKRPSPSRSTSPIPGPSVPVGLAAPDLFSDDMRREQQRQKWEEEENRIKSKPDVHYQDVLFNEARQHGVGYFAFSTEESERRAQQAALKTLRAETEKQQAATNAARQRRADLLNKRLRAAHNRKRAKEGLPPLAADEPLPQTERAESPPPDPEPPQIHLAADPAKRGQLPRPTPSVRPWDIGKEGLPEKPVMSQEEWVSQKRKERPNEFAPPSFYEDRNPSEAFRNAPSHSKLEYDSLPPEKPKGLFFSSKKKRKTNEEPYRKSMEEVEDFTEEEEEAYTTESVQRKPKCNPSRKGIEIPPPPTMEYFGPSDKTVDSSRKYANATRPQSTQDLESSISAGLSYLRQQQEEKAKIREKGLLGIL